MIDFHVHLDLYPNPHITVKQVAELGIYALSVTTTPSAWRVTSALAPPNSRIRTALGLHPQIAHERICELSLFDSYLSETMYVGEIGLDGAKELKKHWQSQLMVFDHILEACQIAGGRIMSIHSRHAASPVLDRLTQFSKAGTPVLHWFSGSQRELHRAIDLDCWFSIGPAMLLSEKGKKIASEIPKDRILTETDGPFALINDHNIQPWDTVKAIGLLAEVWGIESYEVDKILYTNLKNLLSM